MAHMPKTVTPNDKEVLLTTTAEITLSGVLWEMNLSLRAKTKREWIN